MKKFSIAISAIILLCFSACQKFSMQVLDESLSENLLKNSEFQTASSPLIASHWSFANYSKNPGLEYCFSDNFFRLETSGGHFAYLLQEAIAVEEGERYFAQVYLRQNTRSLLWIVPVRFSSEQSNIPPEQRYVVNPEHGESLRKELELFINPDYLHTVSETEWQPCSIEFVVPQDKGITHYDFRIGAYGGHAGFLEVSKPSFVKSKRNITVLLKGKDLVELTLLATGDRTIEKIDLDQNKTRQKVNLQLDSRLLKYSCIIKDKYGKTYRTKL